MQKETFIVIGEFLYKELKHYERELEKEKIQYFDPEYIFIDSYGSKIALLNKCYPKFNSVDDLADYLNKINLEELYIPQNEKHKNEIPINLREYINEIISKIKTEIQ